MSYTIFLQSAANPSGEGSPLVTMGFMLAGLVVFYLFILRPQRAQQKEQNDFLSSLKKGKKIVTSGGIHGTIVEIGEDNNTVSVLIAPKTIITIQKAYISIESTNTVYGAKPAEK